MTQPTVDIDCTDAPEFPPPISWRDLLRGDYPTPPCLLPPWLHEGCNVLVSGWRGRGKSHFALGVALAVASSGVFLGWQAPDAHRVLFVDGEMPLWALKSRLAKAVGANGREPADDALAFMCADCAPNGLPNLFDPAAQLALSEQSRGYGLLVLDNINALFRGGEGNNDKTWAPFADWLRQQRRDRKAVLMLDHEGKIANGARGSSAKQDPVDVVLELQPPPDGIEGIGARFRVKCTKPRHFLPGDLKPFTAELDPHSGSWTVTGSSDAADSERSERDAEILYRSEKGESVREIAKALNLSKSRVQEVIATAKRAGLNGHAGEA